VGMVCDLPFLRNIFPKKNALITGSCGLIGSEVSENLARQGFRIFGIDNNQRAFFFGPEGDTRWTLGRFRADIPSYTHFNLDIRDRGAILDLVAQIRPDVIVHAAAQPSHDRAAAIPFDDFDTNAVGTLNMLEAARRGCPESPFVHMSTNKVYGDLPNDIPLRETQSRWEYDDAAYQHGIPETFSIDQSKHSLFGASKVGADVMVQEYGRYFGMPTCCLRGGCLTGPAAKAQLHRPEPKRRPHLLLQRSEQDEVAFSQLADHPFAERYIFRNRRVVGKTSRYDWPACRKAGGVKILITGICGFVGSHLARAIAERVEHAEIVGIDNLFRPGSESNRAALASAGIRFIHGDLRVRSDVDALPSCDWVIDAAANPSVTAGLDGRSSARQLGEHNLSGTLNVLEYCRERNAGLVLLSTSRVYSVRDLSALGVVERDGAFVLGADQPSCRGVSDAGVSELFPARQPFSLYGATKLCCEIMAIEYGSAFRFPVWVNRCGNLAGAGQFGTAEQGIFSYWIGAHRGRLPLRYVGFGGHGYQVRDALHPSDLAELICLQIRQDPPPDSVYNIGGGAANSMSIAQLTKWCDERFGRLQPKAAASSRPFDIPWMVMDYTRAAQEFGWAPRRPLDSILNEIAVHACEHPEWSALCGAA
jgi:CDP-paratose 2-epimerase